MVLAIKRSCYVFRQLLRQQKGLPASQPSPKAQDWQELLSELRLLREERHSVWNAREKSYQTMADGEAARRSSIERELQLALSTALAQVNQLNGDIDQLQESERQSQAAAATLVHQLAEAREELAEAQQQGQTAAASALRERQRAKQLEEELAIQRRSRRKAEEQHQRLQTDAARAQAHTKQLEEELATQRGLMQKVEERLATERGLRQKGEAQQQGLKSDATRARQHVTHLEGELVTQRGLRQKMEEQNQRLKEDAARAQEHAKQMEEECAKKVEEKQVAELGLRRLKGELAELRAREREQPQPQQPQQEGQPPPPQEPQRQPKQAKEEQQPPERNAAGGQEQQQISFRDLRVDETWRCLEKVETYEKDLESFVSDPMRRAERMQVKKELNKHVVQIARSGLAPPAVAAAIVEALKGHERAGSAPNVLKFAELTLAEKLAALATEAHSSLARGRVTSVTKQIFEQCPTVHDLYRGIWAKAIESRRPPFLAARAPCGYRGGFEGS